MDWITIGLAGTLSVVTLVIGYETGKAVSKPKEKPQPETHVRTQRSLNQTTKSGKRIYWTVLKWKNLDLDVAYIVTTDGSKEVLEVFYQNILLPSQFITDQIWNQLMDVINEREG